MGSVAFQASCCQKNTSLKFEYNSPSKRKPEQKSDVNQKIRTTLHMQSGLNSMSKSKNKGIQKIETEIDEGAADLEESPDPSSHLSTTQSFSGPKFRMAMSPVRKPYGEHSKRQNSMNERIQPPQKRNISNDIDILNLDNLFKPLDTIEEAYNDYSCDVFYTSNNPSVQGDENEKGAIKTIIESNDQDVPDTQENNPTESEESKQDEAGYQFLGIVNTLESARGQDCQEQPQIKQQFQESHDVNENISQSETPEDGDSESSGVFQRGHFSGQKEDQDLVVQENLLSSDIDRIQELAAVEEYSQQNADSLIKDFETFGKSLTISEKQSALQSNLNSCRLISSRQQEVAIIDLNQIKKNVNEAVARHQKLSSANSSVQAAENYCLTRQYSKTNRNPLSLVAESLDLQFQTIQQSSGDPKLLSFGSTMQNGSQGRSFGCPFQTPEGKRLVTKKKSRQSTSSKSKSTMGHQTNRSQERYSAALKKVFSRPKSTRNTNSKIIKSCCHSTSVIQTPKQPKLIRKRPKNKCSIITMGQQYKDENEGTQEDLLKGNNQSKSMFRKIAQESIFQECQKDIHAYLQMVKISLKLDQNYIHDHISIGHNLLKEQILITIEEHIQNTVKENIPLQMIYFSGNSQVKTGSFSSGIGPRLSIGQKSDDTEMSKSHELSDSIISLEEILRIAEACQFKQTLQITCDSNFSGELCFKARSIFESYRYKFNLQINAASDRDRLAYSGHYRALLQEKTTFNKYIQTQGFTSFVSEQNNLIIEHKNNQFMAGLQHLIEKCHKAQGIVTDKEQIALRVSDGSAAICFVGNEMVNGKDIEFYGKLRKVAQNNNVLFVDTMGTETLNTLIQNDGYFVVTEFGNDEVHGGDKNILYVMTYLNHFHSWSHIRDEGCYYCIL